MAAQYDEVKGGPLFDRVRGAVWGVPGFKRRQSTVTATLPIAGPTATHVVETIRTDEGTMVFIQAILPEGTYRIVLPAAVVNALARHRDSLTAEAKRERARRAAETRKAAGVIPFQRKERTGG